MAIYKGGHYYYRKLKRRRVIGGATAPVVSAQRFNIILEVLRPV